MFILIFLQSSLLHLLLGELPIESGELHINGSISYASQEPWLFTETVRANILFGELYNKERYNEVRLELPFTAHLLMIIHKLFR